jgi:hypothetical protein
LPDDNVLSQGERRMDVKTLPARYKNEQGGVPS